MDRNGDLLLAMGCATDRAKVDAITTQACHENVELRPRASRQSLADCAGVSHLPGRVPAEEDRVSAQDDATFKDLPVQPKSVDGRKTELGLRELDGAVSHGLLSGSAGHGCSFALTVTTLPKSKLLRRSIRVFDHSSQTHRGGSRCTSTVSRRWCRPHLVRRRALGCPRRARFILLRQETRQLTLRPRRNTQSRPPETRLAATQGGQRRSRDRAARCGPCHPTYIFGGFLCSQRGLQRPERCSQFRPPEPRLTTRRSTSLRSRDRPHRHSQCRPPEAVSAFTYTRSRGRV